MGQPSRIPACVRAVIQDGQLFLYNPVEDLLPALVFRLVGVPHGVMGIEVPHCDGVRGDLDRGQNQRRWIRGMGSRRRAIDIVHGHPSPSPESDTKGLNLSARPGIAADPFENDRVPEEGE